MRYVLMQWHHKPNGSGAAAAALSSDPCSIGFGRNPMPLDPSHLSNARDLGARELGCACKQREEGGSSMTMQAMGPSKLNPMIAYPRMHPLRAHTHPQHPAVHKQGGGEAVCMHTLRG